MKPILFSLLAFSVLLIPAPAQKGTPFAGRWDLTVTPQTGNPFPDWMELVDRGGKYDVRLQPRSGTVHPVEDVKVESGKLMLGIAPSGKNPAVTWELQVSGDKVSGVQKSGDKVTAQIAGVRAPVLKRPSPKAWTNPEPLFDGKDLNGWEPFPATATNHWVAQDGVLVNLEHGANLKTTRKFQDFKLHIEFNCPDDGNSGIYLRGRDEIQVAYEKPGVNDKFHDLGAIYGFIAPAVELPKKPGQWESFDITLVGRMLTVVRDGVKTIDNQEIAGISGGALDSNEAEPGPFYLQGDHTGGMKYRNITVSLPK